MKELYAKMEKSYFLSQPLEQITTPKCPDHGKKMKMFCFDCKRVICRDCVLIKHKDHSYEFLKTVCSEVKKSISERFSALKKIHKNVGEAMALVTVTKDDITSQKESTVGMIEEKFAELHEALARHKKLLLEEASRIAEKKLESLSVQENQLRTTMADIQSVFESIEHKVKTSTDEELICTREQVLSSIDEAIGMHNISDNLQPVEEADIRPNLTVSTDDIQRMLMSKAQLKCSSADPSKCVVEYDCDETRKNITMVLKPYLPNSKPTMKIQSVEAYVTAKADGVVFLISPERMPDNSYKLTFRPQIRGRHEVEISINNEQVAGSPFPVMVQAPPQSLGNPLKIIKGLKKPWGVAINSKDELVVTEHNGNVVFLNKVGTKLREIRRRDHSFEFLSGVAVDNDDNVYVADYGRNTIFKFNRWGKLLKIVGQKGRGPCEFNKPRGLAVFEGHVYVCDYDNNRVQVLTLELNFVNELSNFKEVRDIAIDEHGYMYICDTGNNRIQVVNDQSEMSYSFDAKERRSLIGPCGVSVMNDFVYVIENPLCKDENVSVFTKEGNFVTAFGNFGKEEGQFNNPYGIAIDLDGFVYVCDYGNSRIQVF